jgi:hypothetical protein
LSTVQSAATRAPARAARDAAEAAPAEESLRAHARRLLCARAGAAATALLDPGIAALQWLRKRAGGAPDAEAGEERPGSRMERPGARHNAAAPAAEAESAAPQPRRRLRAILVYVSVLLAGGMGGAALAYDMLAKLLERQATESRRLEAVVAKQAKSAATASKQLEDAEKKLAASLAELTKSAAEKKIDDAQKGPGAVLAATGTSDVPRPAGAGRKAAPPKTGNCALGSGNTAAALNDCVKDFNR